MLHLFSLYGGRMAEKEEAVQVQWQFRCQFHFLSLITYKWTEARPASLHLERSAVRTHYAECANTSSDTTLKHPKYVCV